ncbi:UPF0271 protein [Ferrimonas sediminum]|uniref:UPF0271 protein n=1 Tax=Ferrimonas sediminum TaxID=718193 RepID=A0A1G8SB06_9GAMM|nr:5-oxoprolinase subunit PxpA [Ferrimonas sediminum]SDJ26399.1 UPF0271 protein [Ferrimonas sediminum]
MRLDINVDIGEGFPFDESLLPWVSSASIACGGHAGNRDSMEETVRLCVKHRIRIGAHPAFPDRAHFGRQPMAIDATKLQRSLSQQIDQLEQICRGYQVALHYVKPHGALYNLAAFDDELAGVLCRAIIDGNRPLTLMGLSGSRLLTEARRFGLPTLAEAFIDRRYLDDGTLVSRRQDNAILSDPDEIIAQLEQLALRGQVQSQSGRLIPIQVDSLCLHGDDPDALNHAMLAHNHLRGLGFSIACD